jgi:hypothetical protein
VNLHADGQGARKRCSGFWIDWDKENKTGIVLTTAHLFSSMGCSVEQEGKGVEGEYAPHGEVKYYPHAKVSSCQRLGTITLSIQLTFARNLSLIVYLVPRRDKSNNLKYLPSCICGVNQIGSIGFF